VRGEQRLVWRKMEWGAAVERGRKMVKWRGGKGEDAGPCLGREDGEAASKNGLSGRFLLPRERRKFQPGGGRRLR